MAQVTIEINGYAYTIGCDDGEEERVAALGAFLDRRARGLAGQVGNPGEARLLAMTALLLADDLHNAHEEIDRLRQQLAVHFHAVRRQRQPSGAEPFHHLGIDPVFLRQQVRGQRFRCMVIADRQFRLKDHRAAVELGGDEVDAGAVRGVAGVDGALVRMQPLIFRQP